MCIRDSNKTENYSDTVESGRVISQTPSEGNKAPKGSVITVTVSLGKEDTKIRVPNLIGLSEQDGTVEAIEAGLTVGSVTYIYSDEVGEGMICYPVSYTHLDVYKRQEERKLVHKPGELGVTFHVAGLMDFDVEVPMPGKFSVYNALAAIAICRHFKVDAVSYTHLFPTESMTAMD